MKPILIIDDYGPSAYDEIIDLNSWSSEGLVDFRQDLQQPEKLQIDEYEAVFIHANHPKLNWLIPKLSNIPSIQFTGEQISDPGLSGMTYHTTRGDFYDRVKKIIEQYEKTESIRPEDLQPSSERRREASDKNFSQLVNSDDSAYDEAEVITFDSGIDTPDLSTQTYPVVEGEGKEEGEGESSEIDFVKTLRPLANIDEPTPIYLEESYTDRVGGLEVLLRIRLGDALGGSFSRFPVFARLSSPEAALSEAKPSYIVALMETAQYGPQFPEPDSILENGALSGTEIERFLDNVPVRPQSGIDHHDLSNAWGAFRLWRGHQLLSGASTNWEDMPDELHTLRDRLLRQKYYMYLAARSVVFGSSAENLSEEDVANPLSAWSGVVEEYSKEGDPIQILLIEDEAERGWETVLRGMVGADEDRVELEVIPEGERFDFKDALSVATGKPWDAVLCDLRLSSWKDPERTASPDPTKKTGYSGVDLVSEIKAESPFTPTIAFTSSNNVWTIEAAEDAGVQNYWVKESPQTQRDDTYSRKSASELLSTITDSVAHRRRWLFLEELFRSFSARRQEDGYASTFARISPEEKVRKRLEGIEQLLRRAYGFCYRSPSTFQRDELKHSRQDSLNHVFLQLWGCLNEIVQLRFDNPEGGECRMLRSDRSVEMYWESPDVQGASSWVEDYLNPEGSRRNSLSIYPYESDSESGSDWLYVALLLRECDEKGLEKDLGRCKGLRNSIDIIHGHTTEQAESVRFDKHLVPLTSIIANLIFLRATE